MYAITGVTGQVGGAAARALLAAGHEVRAVLRDETKAAQWRERGAEIAPITRSSIMYMILALVMLRPGAFLTR